MSSGTHNSAAPPTDFLLRASNHLLTNLALLEKFLPVSTRVAAAGENWLIEIEAVRR